MKRLLLLFAALMFIVSQQASAAEPGSERDQVKAARLILDAWHDDQPEPVDRFLHLVCWTPSDRELPADYQTRLTRIMEHIRGFYAREMARLGFGERSFNLKYNGQKHLVLHTVKGKHDTSHYAVQSGSEIRNECLPGLKQAGIDASRETILIFCNLATWNEEQRRFTHKSPYYAGGSFRGGTAWQLDSPELDSNNLKLKQPMIRDGQYGRISLGKHNSIFIGGIAHELGHALGLPHCRARPDETARGTALMGSGNRTYGDELRDEGQGSFLTLAHALRLASHPQFSGSVKGMSDRVTASIDDLSIVADGKSIRVTGNVKGEPPVYAVVAYFDPAGGSDYDSTTATAVPASDGSFELSSDSLRRGKQGELRLFPLHVNGSAAGQMSRTKFRYPYSISDNGVPDLSAMQLRFDLAPVLDALARNDRKTAAQLASSLKSPKAMAIARNLTQPATPTQTPAEYESDSATVALTSLKSDSARVGWGRPAFNRIPDRVPLLECGGQIFETGIYAHAPAGHTYLLGAKWKKLTGKAGLASGHNGSVEFEITGDGKRLWKSRVVKPGMVVEFDVPLDGVQKVELLTHPTADGPGSDWGLWLEPSLHRRP
ncbi:MAG: NPCBM/NEW2 domain-containing protein [Planctomycetales bacterium]|jgi:hypothetical protein